MQVWNTIAREGKDENIADNFVLGKSTIEEEDLSNSAKEVNK